MSRLARRLALGMLLAFAAPAPAGAEPDGYEGLRSYGGDTHVHSGTPAGAYLQTLPTWKPACADCPSVWCTRMYAFARSAGYDWVVSTNHEGSLPSYYKPGDPFDGLALTPEILAWWKRARPDYSNPSHPADVYPTHPAGFPLYDGSGKHTDDQNASLASCADAATENGRFVAFLGIEYTAAPAGEGCLTAAVGCGGHKTVIFPRARNRALGERACTGTWGESLYDDQCRTLGEVYRNVAATGGVVHIAHPNFGPKPGLARFEANGPRDNGGIDPNLVVGAEVSEASPESKPGLASTYSSTTKYGPGLNIGGILARGHRIHPVFGSDVHFRPTAKRWVPLQCAQDRVLGARSHEARSARRDARAPLLLGARRHPASVHDRERDHGLVAPERRGRSGAGSARAAPRRDQDCKARDDRVDLDARHGAHDARGAGARVARERGLRVQRRRGGGRVRALRQGPARPASRREEGGGLRRLLLRDPPPRAPRGRDLGADLGRSARVIAAPGGEGRARPDPREGHHGLIHGTGAEWERWTRSARANIRSCRALAPP